MPRPWNPRRARLKTRSVYLRTGVTHVMAKFSGVSSSWVVWHVFFERYTHVFLESSPEFPIHFLKIYREAQSGHAPARGRGRPPGEHAVPGGGWLAASTGVVPRPNPATGSFTPVHH